MGNMGRSHAKNIIAKKVEGCTLTAVCDVAETVRESFPEQRFFSSAEEMIKSGEIDAILIATPHYDHTTIGIAALQAGLHVLVEKPISVHKADCEKLIAAYQNPKQIFAAMFNQRTDPAYRKVRQLIQDGELGEIRRVNWIITDWFRTESYYASGGWRATWGGEGGGVLLNQCPHQLDLFQWMFGVPEKVHGFCSLGRYHDIEVEDDVTAYFTFPNGSTGVFITSTGECPGTNRLEITSDRGKLVVENRNLTFTRTEKSVAEWSRTCPGGFTKVDSWTIDIPVSGYGGQHIEIMQNFVNAISKGEELIAPAVEGIHSVEIANAILLSSFRNEPVNMPLDGAEYEAVLKKKIADSTFVKKTSAGNNPSDFDKSF